MPHALARGLKPLAATLVAAIALASTACTGGDRAETTFQRTDNQPREDYWQVDTGVGGRPAQERGMGDPLRFAFAGIPETDPMQPELTVLWNSGYVVGFDHGQRAPTWVAYRLFNGEQASKGKDGAKGTATDARVPAPAAPEKGKDRIDVRAVAPRGPIAACYGDEAGEETRLHSNHAPAIGDAGWDELLALEPAYAEAYQELWVTAGTLPGGEGWWKVHVTVHEGHPRAQAFIFPKPAPDAKRQAVDLATRLVTVEELEARTGLRLFSGFREVGDHTRELFATALPEGLWPTAPDAQAAR